MRLLRRDYGPSVKEAGNLTKPELARVLGGAHVFVMPSLAEGSALVSYEALASGLPSLVTHETGSIVRNGIEGFVVAARDSTALASRIRDLHDNPGLRRQMSLAARARAEEFSWPAYRRRLLAAIDSAVPSNQVVHSAIA
jgi:glycosyltransferase involved in cell wall biosynthesis